MRITFKNWDCKLEPGFYGNGQKAIELVDPETGEPIATATVNLPNEFLMPYEVFIKDYAENEGMAQALIDHGVIGSEISRTCKSGFVSINSYFLSNEALCMWDKFKSKK